MREAKPFPWGSVLRIVAVLVAISFVLSLVKFEDLWNNLKQISLGILVLALLINVGRQALIAFRWRLMNTESAEHSFGQYFLFTLVSAPAQLFLPGIVGVDLARGMLIGQSAEKNHAQHLISVLSDRVIGLLSVILLGMGFALFAPHFPHRWKYMGFLSVLLVAFVVGLAVSLSPLLHRLLLWGFGKLGKVGEKGESLLTLWIGVMAFFRKEWRRVLWALLLCFLIHFSWFLIVYLLAQNLSIPISFFVVVTVTAISWVVLAIPVSWMGLGVNELSFIFLLSFQGISREASVALSLHQAAINILFALLCLPLLLFVKGKVKAREEAKKAEESKQKAEEERE